MDTRENSPPAARRPRRRAANQIWSASSTVEWIDSDGRTVMRSPDSTTVPEDAVKAKVHYRVEGKTRKPTFAEPGLAAQISAFQALLAAARANDWPADATGRPTLPAGLPATQPPEGLATAAPAWSNARLGALPATAVDHAIRDVEDLVKWYRGRVASTPKRNGGPRSPTTNGGYGGHLDFFLALARYPAEDPRLAELGLEAGTFLRVDDPATGIGPRDLIAMVETRTSTNLRTRAANEAGMAAWVRSVQQEDRRAARRGRDPVLPPMPEPETEVALSRTIGAFAQPVRAMFIAAHKRGLIGHQPWTADVDDETPRAGGVHYTAKSLPTRDRVGLAVEAMRTTWRRSTTTDGYAVSYSGDRFAGLVWVAGRQGTRPEESIALRNSWVILDDEDPRIELHWAEVYHPNPNGSGRIRVQVPLKHRQPGDIRVLRPDPEDVEEFVHVLSASEPGADLTRVGPMKGSPAH